MEAPSNINEQPSNPDNFLEATQNDSYCDRFLQLAQMPYYEYSSHSQALFSLSPTPGVDDIGHGDNDQQLETPEWPLSNNADLEINPESLQYLNSFDMPTCHFVEQPVTCMDELDVVEENEQEMEEKAVMEWTVQKVRITETPDNTDHTFRVPIWDTTKRIALSGTSAPRRENLVAFLQLHPSYEVYTNQDEGKHLLRAMRLRRRSSRARKEWQMRRERYIEVFNEGMVPRPCCDSCILHINLTCFCTDCMLLGTECMIQCHKHEGHEKITMYISTTAPCEVFYVHPKPCKKRKKGLNTN